MAPIIITTTLEHIRKQSSSLSNRSRVKEASSSSELPPSPVNPQLLSVSRPYSGTPTATLATLSRNIVILLDGTANKYGDKNSNVLKLMSVIGADEENQIVYYSSGFGEWQAPSWVLAALTCSTLLTGTILPDGTSTWGKFKQKLAKAADMGFAW